MKSVIEELEDEDILKYIFHNPKTRLDELFIQFGLDKFKEVNDEG